jgi:cell division protease FtsH
MPNFPWFPFGHNLPDGRIGRLRQEGDGFQIVADQESEGTFLVIESGSLVNDGVNELLDPVRDGFRSFRFGGTAYLSRLFDKAQEPLMICDWRNVLGLPTSSDALALAGAIRRLRAAFPKADCGQAIFLPAFDQCLPVKETNTAQNMRSLAIEILVAGARLSSFDVRSIRSINSWLTPVEIAEFLSALGIDAPSPTSPTLGIDPASFVLAGRPEIEQFFREYVLEPAADRERYAAFGVKAPNGVLLFGPPGSGKSHAVGKLRAALNWPTFEIDLGALGSPLIHQTSVALRKAFDEAKRNAPALIVLEELDALAPSRGPLTHDYKIEEVTELLRFVERASDSGILVVATTNRRDALDPATLRKGRFDHAIELGYPTAEQVFSVLNALLHDRPHSEVFNLDRLATKLAGRALSDIAWVVNEAARLAARAKKEAIDEIDSFSAMNRLESSSYL